MKKFLTRLALFGSPFLVAWLLMMIVPLDREYAYSYAEKDSPNFPFVYGRIFENLQPVDLAFIGTSRTMAAVDDGTLEQTLSSSYGKELKIANLGVNRNGRNLHWVITRHLFEKKKPKGLVLEVPTSEGKFSHLDYPYIASTGQLFTSRVIGNKSYLQNIGAGTEVRFLYYRDGILGSRADSVAPLDLRDHSHLLFDSITVADPALLADFESRRMTKIPRNLPQDNIGKMAFWWKYSFSKSYIKRIAEECRENGVQLYFLYLPGYGMPVSQPVDTEWYASLGTFWIPPDTLFRNPKNWHDPDHLSAYGTQKLTVWLANEINKEN